MDRSRTRCCARRAPSCGRRCRPRGRRRGARGVDRAGPRRGVSRMLRAMSESYVDLTYRGLALGRRVKLTQVRPSAGYLELPTPMPVGTTIAIVTDEGVALDARVLAI